MEKLTNTMQRVAKWDNAKAFLILMVVFGHAISPFWGNGPAMKFTDLWINVFHMPLFVFIGGLFSKRTINAVPFKYDKVVGFLLLSFFIKVMTYLSTVLSGGKASFSLLSENGVAWYIFVMAVHLMIAHLLRTLEPWKVFFASILLAMGAGYIDEVGNTLVLSRIIVFFPVFYLGYMLDKDNILNFVNKTWVRICSAIFLVVFTASLYFAIDKVFSLRYVLTCNNPYYEFGEDWYPYGALLRLFCYILSAVVSTAVLALIPNKRLPVLTFCGTKTLQVYALHRPVQLIMEYTFLRELMKDTQPRFLLPLLFGISLILTLALSLKPFEYILYPCTNWQKFFAPVIKWFQKKDSTDNST